MSNPENVHPCLFEPSEDSESSSSNNEKGEVENTPLRPENMHPCLFIPPEDSESSSSNNEKSEVENTPVIPENIHPCLFEVSDDSESSSSNNEECEVENTPLVRDHFIEHEEINELIKRLPVQYEQESQLNHEILIFEQTHEKFKFILDQYQEQSHLLDPHLGELIFNIMVLLSNEDVHLNVKHRAFKYLYLIMKVRGYKHAVTYLPHEVKDMEPVIQLLENQNNEDTSTWETRHCLLIWLSIIIMIPFNMSVLDSSDQESTTINRIMTVGKVYLKGLDTCREGAALVLARLVVRDDVKQVHLQPFLNWLIETVAEGVLNDRDWTKIGPMNCLAAILKHGKREDLLPLASELLGSIIVKFKSMDRSYPLSAKVYIKIIYRLGLIFLKPRVASWRYQRGARSLDANLHPDHQLAAEDPASAIEEGAEEESDMVEGAEGESDDEQINEDLEEIVEELINGLKNDNYIVRWSAAKGIGRIVSRLNRNNGDDIVAYVISVLEPLNSEESWHGACLAIAELAKNGLVLTSRLPCLLPLLNKALVYEELRGYSSVGRNVRDAACYIWWSIARAYHPVLIQPFIMELAPTLISVALFDREINCRRAAAAAFQESVGRLGNIPHGIQIITIVDYFTVRDKYKTYLKLSTKVAEYEEYTRGLIDHLLECKINNWDPVIRKLVAKALFKLTPFAPDYVASHGLATLLPKINAQDRYARHGSILAIGEIVHALSQIDGFVFDGETLESIENVFSNMMEVDLNEEPTINSPIGAALNFIANCAKAGLPFHGKDVIAKWQCCIEKYLADENAELRNEAVSACKHICTEYYCSNTEEMDMLRADILQRFMAALDDSAIQTLVGYALAIGKDDEILNSRLGHTLALGSLPASMLKGHLPEVIDKLQKCTTMTQETVRWAEARQAALNALASICTTVRLSKTDGELSCYTFVGDILEIMLLAMDDYTVDLRGDAGAWVREAAMQGIHDILLMAVDEAIELVVPLTINRVFVKLAQQAVEKIDRTRAIAGKVFSGFLMKQDKPLPHIPAEDRLRAIFNEEVCDKTKWHDPDVTLPLFIQLLNIPEFSYGIMMGLVSTIGSLKEPLAGKTVKILVLHLQEQPLEVLENLSNDILCIFERNKNIDWITIPLFHFLERILAWNCLSRIFSNPSSSFATKLYNLANAEISKSTSSKKLIASVEFFCHMIQVPGEVSRRSLVKLTIMLVHRFLWLRRVTATKLIAALTLYEDELQLKPDVLQEVLKVLSETKWADADKEMVKSQRNAICELLNIPKPVAAGASLH